MRMQLAWLSTKESRVVWADSLDDLRGDGLAGTAPGGEEVDDHQGAGLGASGIKVGLAVGVVSRRFLYARLA